MFNLFFNKKNEIDPAPIETLHPIIEKPRLSKDEIATMLRISPEALAKFESEYQKAALDYNETSHNPIDTSIADVKSGHAGADEIASLIVDDIINGKNQVSLADIKSLPKEIRPQLTAGLYTVDCDRNASSALLMM